MKTFSTWVLVANGARARHFSVERHGNRLRMVQKRELRSDHSPSRELGRDRPTRVYESNGAARHAVEPKSDPHRELKRHFAKQVTGTLDEGVSQDLFDRLVVVAPAVTLGDLRGSLSERVKALVIAELIMDLTGMPNSEVCSHIEKALPI